MNRVNMFLGLFFEKYSALKELAKFYTNKPNLIRLSECKFL